MLTRYAHWSFLPDTETRTPEAISWPVIQHRLMYLENELQVQERIKDIRGQVGPQRDRHNLAGV